VGEAVSFGSYTGASLQILAGGSVTADSITITGPDAVNLPAERQCGKITVQATDSVVFDDVGSNGTGTLARVAAFARDRGGELEITGCYGMTLKNLPSA
jgi:hypothetical protein